ncbi:MAG: hypothetical protein ACO295_00490 [Sediminibacterium sp.]
MAIRGDSKKIIVGAAQLFISKSGALEYVSGTGPDASYAFTGQSASASVPAFSASTSYADTLEAATANWRNVGYTMNGLEVQFQPDFGEVQVDQLLDVARLYKQGMQVNMATAFAESTLENLLVAVAAKESDFDDDNADLLQFNIASGDLGEVPVERALIAVGPGSGDPAAVGVAAKERVYTANRALSIDNVTVSAKRDEASMFEVSFRLLPAANGSYGKIVDRTVGTAGEV